MTGLKQKNNTRRNVKEELKVTSQLSTWRPNYAPTHEEFARLAQELIDWARNGNGIKVEEFKNHKGVSGKVFQQWCEKSPELDEANTLALSIIGTRRERKALEGEWNPYIVMNTMPLYDKKFRSFYKWKQQLTAKEQHKQQDIKVIIEAAPSSDLVPKMVKD